MALFPMKQKKKWKDISVSFFFASCVVCFLQASLLLIGYCGNLLWDVRNKLRILVPFLTETEDCQTKKKKLEDLILVSKKQNYKKKRWQRQGGDCSSSRGEL